MGWIGSGCVVPHLNFLEFSSDVHDTFLRIARSYERRIRTGGVTRTGQARLQHHCEPKEAPQKKEEDA